MGSIFIPLQTIPYPGDSELTPASNFGPNSARGRRKAYESVVKSQWEKFSACNITFFSLLSTYSFQKKNRHAKKPAVSLNVLLTLQNNGMT